MQPPSDNPRDTFDSATLARYLAGECVPVEAAAVRRWIETDPERVAWFDTLRAAWDAGGAPVSAWDVGALRTRVLAHVDSDAPAAVGRALAPPGRGPDPFRRTPWAGTPRRAKWRRPWAVAMGSLAAAVVFGLATRGTGVAWWVKRAPVAGPMQEIATRRGERADLLLANGTHVVLGYDSRLRWPKDLLAGSRDISLEGEAYFDVQHLAGHPFIVRTPTAVTEDIGTSFLVRAYPEERAAEVLVGSGRVRLRSATAPGQAVDLGAGDLGQATSSGASVTRRHADIATYTAWTRGRVAFDHTPLADALTQLERQFDLTITVRGDLPLDRRITGTFGEDRPEGVLTALAAMLGAEYRRAGAHVTLSLWRGR